MHFASEPLNEFLSKIFERALERSKRYLVAEGELLESIVEIDKYRIFEKFSETHLTPFCVKYLDLSDSVAANFVRVARKSHDVPELKDAVTSGELDLTKAKAIVSVITADNQALWIDKAQNLSKAKLEREIAAASPQAPKPEKAKPVSEDRTRFELELNTEEKKLFRRCQDLVSAKERESAGISKTFVATMKFFLEHHDPVKKAERSLKRKAKKTHRSREQSHAHVTHAVNLRDQGECQGQKPDGTKCKSTRWVHHHHIIPREMGGQDTVENLITLCSAHHRLWHARQKGLRFDMSRDRALD